MASNPKYLDLDALEDESIFSIKLNGQSHDLVPITVRDFIKNTKIIAALPATMSVEKETEVLIEMLGRAFPSIKSEEFWSMSLSQLNKLMAFAQANNGSDKANAEATASAEANPPVAAS